MRILKSIIYLISINMLISCGETEMNKVEKEKKKEHREKGKGEGANHHHHHHGNANEYMNQTDFADLVKRFESPDRDAYQKPDEVLEYIGDLSGLTVMDIGAGTGYFSFKLVDAGAKVIAADVDDRFQNYIREKRDSLGISAGDLQLRKLPYDSPSLDVQEVDKVIIVNTYHHIGNRTDYFAKVHRGLKDGGELIVIDFFKKELPVGPPVEMKIPASKVESELKKAGFGKIEANSDLLEYQFIIRAKKE